MDAELEQQLIDSYPMLYEFSHLPTDDVPNPTPPIVFDGFACGDGWYRIVDCLSDFLESTINEHPKRPTIHATQVKQKWGRLRMYTDPMPDIAFGAIHMAEGFSSHMCESCGTVAEVDIQETDGWRAALCQDCDPPRNY